MMFANRYSGKRIIVTGHTGFKGSWLAVWLQKLGAEVFGIALKPDTNPSHFESLGLDMISYLVDIRNYDEVLKIFKIVKPDMIFHLAAQPLVRYSYSKPLYTFETNVIGTANILNASRDLDMLRAVIVVTTDKCYENREWVWGYRESDPLGGGDPYSASKGCAEIVTASFRKSYFNIAEYGQRHNTLIASARAGNVIGGGDWSQDRLIPDIVRAIQDGRNVQIRNPNATRPWQHVLECLSGYLVLGEKLLAGDKQFAEAWNFAPSVESASTVLDVVKEMKKNWHKCHYEFMFLSKELHEANLLKLDSSKANAVLKWRNVWDLNKTIKMTINWYHDFYENGKILTFDNIDTYIEDAKKSGVEWTN